MAKRRKRRKTTSKKSEYPPFVWMLFGLAIGLSVAFAVYIKDREPQAVAHRAAPQPASLQDSLDENRKEAKPPVVVEKPEDKRFTFYDILPNFEVVTPDEAPDISPDAVPQAIDEPGVYVLQAGSFSEYKDADRRRAQLALHGVESRIQRVTIDDKTYHRVRIGPIDDLAELNVLRSRLREARIDVLRIRVGD